MSPILTKGTNRKICKWPGSKRMSRDLIIALNVRDEVFRELKIEIMFTVFDLCFFFTSTLLTSLKVKFPPLFVGRYFF